MKKFLALALSLAMLVSTVACSTSWVDQALAIVAALTPAITNIVPLVALADKNVSTADVQTIQSYSNQASSALQTVGSLINQYNQAEATAKPGILSQIESALAVAQSNLNALLPQLHIVDPRSQAAVSAAIATAISELGSIEALLPVLKAGRTADAVALAKPLSASKFRSRYNDAIKPIPGAKKLMLHNPHRSLEALGSAIGESLFGGNR